MNIQQEITVKIAMDLWNGYIQRADKLISALEDEWLLEEIAPKKNTGIYLLGHLIAVHDKMLPLLNLGKQLYPELEEAFFISPDKSNKTMPTVKELKDYWKTLNTVLNMQFAQLTPDEWFQKHNSVLEEDFIKEPHRNRIGVLMSRTTHLSYHFGQLIYLKP